MLEENLLISKGTSVGAGTVITNSVIGRNCTIGKDKNLMCDLLSNLLRTVPTKKQGMPPTTCLNHLFSRILFY